MALTSIMWNCDSNAWKVCAKARRPSKCTEAARCSCASCAGGTRRDTDLRHATPAPPPPAIQSEGTIAQLMSNFNRTHAQAVQAAAAVAGSESKQGREGREGAAWTFRWAGD